MLKFIGDFEKLKDYGFEELNGVHWYGKTHLYRDFNNSEMSITKNKKHYGEIEINIYDGCIDEEAINTLYNLIKDGLVIKESD